jgi:23S rRNA pseudoU1915 N3-methylase RlmH
MNRIKTETIPAEELQNHLANLSGAFAIGLESPQTVAQYAINIERYKMPKDYYQNYLKNLNAVTAADVSATAKKYITPANANIIVVGSKDEVAKTMAKYSKAEVAYYDNYGRPMKETQKAVPAGITAAEVMKKYIVAVGGEKAINAIKDIKTVSKASMAMGPQEMTLTITEMKKAGGKMKSTVEGMGMVLNKKVFDGTKGYNEQGGQKMPLTADEITETKEDADIQADLHPEKYGIKRSLKAMETIGDADVYVVEVTSASGKKSTEYYDAKTGYLVKSAQTEEAGEQTVTLVAEYSNYKEVPGSGGYKIPFTAKQSVGPQVITANVESVEVNKNIPDTEFAQ